MADFATITARVKPDGCIAPNAIHLALQTLEAAAAGDASGILMILEGPARHERAPPEPCSAPTDPSAIDALVAQIMGCEVPVVASLSGTISGDGLAVALACCARIACGDTRVLTKDISLGDWPAGAVAEGLARLGGVAIALEMLILGHDLDADAALQAGILDRVVVPDLVRGVAESLAADPVARPIEPAEQRSAVLDAFRARQGRLLRSDPMANAVMGVLGGSMSGADAARSSRRAEAQTSRYIKRAACLAGISPKGVVRPVESVAVIGAGTMGAGIALCFLDAGFPVTLVEADANSLAQGIARIEKLRAGDVAKGRVSATAAQDSAARLTPVTDLAAIASADLVVEAVFENLAVKTALFSRIDAMAKPSAILASNTSFLDLDAIANATRRPASVMGLHFFSPANVMRLLEVVRTTRTDPDLAATGMALGARLGKTAVLVGSCFGFVGNRMVAHRQREALLLVEGGAMPWEVDRALKAFGFAMGPFEMSDLAGLDLGWKREQSTGASLREILCEHGRFGQKSGAGYYDYGEDRRPRPSPLADALIADFVARSGVSSYRATDEEIVDRCILPMVNEGARILAEGIACRASDIDVIWANGYGWPAAKAGPMHYADAIGLPEVVRRLDALAARHGDAFIPAPMLRERAATGGSFTGCVQ